jgi:hypothetical protein
MKTKKQFSMIALALVAIITLAIVNCDGGGDEHTHTWGAWQETTSPTITVDGLETRTCFTCGEKETRPVDALAKPFFGAWELNANGGVLTINANLIKFETSSGVVFLASNLEWEGVENKDNATKDEYPSGYKIKGVYIIKNPDYSDEYSVTFVINAEKNKLKDKNALSDFIFVKQEN